MWWLNGKRVKFLPWCPMIGGYVGKPTYIN